MSESGGGTSEPSMEDILASIRRILNEDGEPVDEGAAGSHPAAQEPQAATQSNQDDVFELDQSMIVEENMAFDQEPEPPPASVAPPGAPAFASSIPDSPDMPLLNAATAAAAGASLGALARVVEQQQRSVAVYPGGPTLEDIVRQELRPLLKSWLDEHLPPMVERLVRAEIERVTAARG